MSANTTTNEALNESITLKLELMKDTTGVQFTDQELSFLKEAYARGSVGRASVKPFNNPERQSAREAVLEIAAGEDKYCYLNFVRTLPSYEDSSKELFNEAFNNFRTGLGPEPKGTDLIINLCLMELVLQDYFEPGVLLPGSISQGAFSDDRMYLKVLAKMSSSQYRFEFKDQGGRMHVTPGPGLRCGCTEILCDHGWAARMVLQIITRRGQTVGVDIDLSALFVDRATFARNQSTVSDEESFVTTQIEPDVKPTTAKYVHEVQAQHTMREQVSKDMVDMLSNQLNSRTELLEETLEELLNERIAQKAASSTEKRSRKDLLRPVDILEYSSTGDSEDVQSTIMPLDSSTQLSRYGKRYMRTGPVYSLRRGKSVLESTDQHALADEHVKRFDVVQGFVKTDSMMMAEKVSNDKIYTINGLASPFTDPKLNFLTHFHTALLSCGMNPMDNPIDALEFIGSLIPQNPTEELMKQVIQRTFDFEDMSVVANPFALPFISVGMLITESCLMKCLTLLHNEYKLLWFESMKCLRVPEFHSEFEGFSTATITRPDPRRSSKRRSTRRDSHADHLSSETDKQTSSKNVASRRPKTGSILGFRK